MKKVYVIMAVAALTLCVASCGNKKANKQVVDEAAQVEEAVPAVVDSVKAAAADVVETGIDAAADAAKDAIKGE